MYDKRCWLEPESIDVETCIQYEHDVHAHCTHAYACAPNSSPLLMVKRVVEDAELCHFVRLQSIASENAA